MSSEDTKPSSSKLQQVSPAPTRARVWRACLVCRKRKVKCNGQEPCAYCISSGKVCSFNDTSDNGANARQHANTVDDRLARVEDTLQRFMPMYNIWAKENNMPSQESLLSSTGRPASSATIRSTPSTSTQVERPRVPYRPSSAILKLMLPTPDSSLNLQSPVINSEQGDEYPTKWSHKSSHLTRDSYGNLRYTGGTSSYMLVDALTSIQDQTTDASPESIPSGKTSTDDHLVLPFFTPNKHFQVQETLPSPEEMPYPTAEMADELVALYFSEIHFTFPILHTQSFVGRYKNAMEARHSGKPSSDHAFLCSLFAVFACGACLRSRNNPNKNPDAGQEYWGIEFYQTAQLLFWRGSGASRMEHVQALSLLAICNASWNTLAQSWLNAGQALRRAQDIGLHRVARRTSLGDFEREMRIRVWWCVYGLDRVLSIALGRPSGAFDDDCDVELPAELDDAQLIQNYDTKAMRPAKCYMTGFVALLRIYVIAGRIMRFVSSSRVDDPKSPRAKEELEDLDSQLRKWLDQLPADIRQAPGNAQNRDPPMVSLSLITYFVYYSCVINLHRPFIPDPETSPGSIDLTSLSQCVRAARSCIQIGEQTETTLPTSHHLAFAVQYITLSGVLLLRCIGFVNQPELLSAILKDSERCVHILHGLQQIWPASKRCREIVSDLLGIVKLKLSGEPMGSPPVAQRVSEPVDKSGRHPSPRAKRKRSSDHDRNHSASRPRLEDDPSQYNWPEGLARVSGSAPQGGDNGFGYGEGSNHERSRMSHLRSSASDHDSSRSSSSMAPPAIPSLLYTAPYSQHEGTSPLTPNSATHIPAPGSRQQPMPNMNFSTEGLPFSGYNFLGEDLYAVVGMHPTSAEPTSQVYADNAQVLWEAYNGQHTVPFNGEHHPHHHQRN